MVINRLRRSNHWISDLGHFSIITDEILIIIIYYSGDMGNFSLPSEIGHFMIGYFTEDLLGHVCCKIIM